jgi:hypothetical protein
MECNPARSGDRLMRFSPSAGRQSPANAKNRTSPIYAVIDTTERMGDDLRDDPG